MQWLNEPQNWSHENDVLKVAVDGGTDFWRITHYDFIRDNGHFFYREESGDFVASVRIRGAYRELYDQGGLMIRIDERNWIKTGIEFVDGRQNLSAVVTREFSDWSVIARDDNPPEVRFRLKRQKDFVEIGYSFESSDFAMLRLAYFPPAVPAQIGMMCAAPDGSGFSIEFDHFTIKRLD
ncbi:MAG: DUF1349 domain-containing protein [Acidobacteria bacterium]|nr:DUF1349 domain-containing protein [Acidobacteriota bacterium]